MKCKTLPKGIMWLRDAGIREREWGQKMLDELTAPVSPQYFWEHAVYDPSSDEIRLNVTLCWEVMRP